MLADSRIAMKRHVFRPAQLGSGSTATGLNDRLFAFIKIVLCNFLREKRVAESGGMTSNCAMTGL